MEFMDIHICGACRTQFNNVEHFIAHKQICPILNRLKRQNQRGGNSDNINESNSAYADLSLFLTRGTSVNLQTLSCPALSVHNTSIPLNSVDKQIVPQTQPTCQSSHVSDKDTGVIPIAVRTSKNHQDNSVPEITETTLDSFSRGRSGQVSQEQVFSHPLHQHSTIEEIQRSAQLRDDHENGRDQQDGAVLIQTTEYNITVNQKQETIGIVSNSSNPHFEETYSNSNIIFSPRQKEYGVRNLLIDGQSLSTESLRAAEDKHCSSPDIFQEQMARKASRDKNYYKGAHQSNISQKHKEDLDSNHLNDPSLSLSTSSAEQLSRSTRQTFDLGYQDQQSRMLLPGTQQIHHHDNIQEQIERSLIYQQQQTETDEDIKQDPVVDQQQDHEQLQQYVQETGTLSHHNYYTNPQTEEVSYIQQENVPEEKSFNENYDHQYLSSYEVKKIPEKLESAQRVSVRSQQCALLTGNSSPRRRSKLPHNKNMDLLRQALNSENVNLEEASLPSDDRAAVQMEYIDSQELPSVMNNAVQSGTDSQNVASYDIHYTSDPSNNLTILATTLQQDQGVQVYSSGISQAENILTTDVEMVEACSFEQMQGDVTQSSIVSTSQPQYVVVKADGKTDKSSGRGKHQKGGKQNKIHKCDYKDCTYQTSYGKDLERHNRTHTGVRPFSCTYCMKCFNRSDKLKIHMRSHTGDKPFQCTECSYAAVDSSSLRKHIRTHTNERPFKCQICSYASRNSSQLVVHLRTHTGDSPFQCGVCHAKFKINSDLKRHSRIHSGEKPFKCELCDYKCSIKANLKTHSRINHSEENKMTCDHDECKFSTSSRKAMRDHNKIHDLSVTLVCNKCKYICNSKSALATHMRIHSEERPYACDFCSYKCKQIGNIKTHIKKKHSEKMRQSKYFLKREISPEPSPVKEEEWKSPNKMGRNAHKCNICTASFVRPDSLRSHTRQHCRDIAMNLETTALAVLQLQNSASSPKKISSESNKYPNKSDKHGHRSHDSRGAGPCKTTSLSKPCSTQNMPKSQPIKTASCGLQEIAEAAVRLEQSSVNSYSISQTTGEALNTSHMTNQMSPGYVSSPVEPAEETILMEQTHQIIQASGPKLLPIGQTFRIPVNQSQTVAVDAQAIVDSNAHDYQMIKLPNGELVSLKHVLSGHSVTQQLPTNQIHQVAQYQLSTQQSSEQQFAVQVVPQQAVPQPQIQIILPSSFYNQMQDVGMASSEASITRQPQILIQLQDANRLSQVKTDGTISFPTSTTPTVLTNLAHNQIGTRLVQGGSSQVLTDGIHLTPLQEVVVQMEGPSAGENFNQTEDCQSETK